MTVYRVSFWEAREEKREAVLDTPASTDSLYIHEADLVLPVLGVVSCDGGGVEWPVE